MASIQMQNISKTYAGGKTVLKNFDLEQDDGALIYTTVGFRL